MTLWVEALIADVDLLTIEDLLARPAWMADALCREYPDVTFFPTRGQPTAPAKAICRCCLVVEECAAYAGSLAEPADGIWGGTSVQERRRLPVKRPPKVARTHRCDGGCGREVPGERGRCGACRQRLYKARRAEAA